MNKLNKDYSVNQLIKSKLNFQYPPNITCIIVKVFKEIVIFSTRMVHFDLFSIKRRDFFYSQKAFRVKKQF